MGGWLERRVTKAMDRSNVPGVTHGGASMKAASVVDNLDDDDLLRSQGVAGSLGRASAVNSCRILALFQYRAHLTRG